MYQSRPNLTLVLEKERVTRFDKEVTRHLVLRFSDSWYEKTDARLD